MRYASKNILLFRVKPRGVKPLAIVPRLKFEFALKRIFCRLFSYFALGPNEDSRRTKVVIKLLNLFRLFYSSEQTQVYIFKEN